MSMDTIYTFDLKKLDFIDGDFKDSDHFSDLIYDGEGSAELEYQWMSFQPERCDFEVCIEYALSLRGGFDECPGDYWTPPSYGFYLDEATISLCRILIDDIETCVSKDVENFFAGLVENKINI
jgi:hypothetical protein